MAGLSSNFSRIHSSAGSTGREYIHSASPSANMFFERSTCWRDRSVSASASRVSVVSGTSST